VLAAHRRALQQARQAVAAEEAGSAQATGGAQAAKAQPQEGPAPADLPEIAAGLWDDLVGAGLDVGRTISLEEKLWLSGMTA